MSQISALAPFKVRRFPTGYPGCFGDKAEEGLLPPGKQFVPTFSLRIGAVLNLQPRQGSKHGWTDDTTPPFCGWRPRNPLLRGRQMTNRKSNSASRFFAVLFRLTGWKFPWYGQFTAMATRLGQSTFLVVEYRR